MRQVSLLDHTIWIELKCSNLDSRKVASCILWQLQAIEGSRKLNLQPMC